MEVPLELNNSRQTAAVIFAGKDDFAFVADWQKALDGDKNPVRVDAADFAWIAAHRFEDHSVIENYAATIGDIGDHIAHNPQSEVACCVLLKCDWFPPSNIIGLAHFRRTWNNNIVLDYLTSHPLIAKVPDGHAHHVRGVGYALLYFMTTIAKKYNCGLIWGEATSTSCGYYKKVFCLESVEDLIHVPRVNFLAFLERFDKKAIGQGDSAPSASPEVEEVYALEEKASAFVGSKTVVFNPRRRLAHRFLDLPHHLQMGVASGLGLLEEADKGEATSEQFRRFFQRASEKQALADLWREVEKLHPDGEPDKNPFLKA